MRGLPQVRHSGARGNPGIAYKLDPGFRRGNRQALLPSPGVRSQVFEKQGKKIVEQARVLLPLSCSLLMAKLSCPCVLLLLLLFCGCSNAVQAPLQRLDASEIPAFHDDLDVASLKLAISQSLTALRQKNGAETVAFGEERIAVARIRDSLTALLSTVDNGEELHAALRRDFLVYRVSTPVLFTGYHEPLVRGSRVRTEHFRYPIYRRPDELVEREPATAGGGKQFGHVVNGRFLPYFSREEIDGRGVLHGKRYELFWVDDPVSLFLLHVQGSGRVVLPDGTRVCIGYAASNGQPYRSIGKLLLEQGKLGPGEATTPAIRRYLYDHLEEQNALLFANPRYIFFHPVPDGPRGSLGAPLTPGRSLAIDSKIYPVGAIGLIRAKRPLVNADNDVSWKAFSRLVLLQDTGAAITGWGRADIFWGADAEAEAGLMAQEGEMYLIVKKP